MDFINPLGRTSEGISPRACMCASGFAGARSSDSCFRCGCGCRTDGGYNSGNWANARTTWRKS